jgi:hypothetical protein
MNVTLMVECASASLVLFAMFKYGFRFIHNMALIRQEDRIIEKVLEKHGDNIANRITETMVSNVNVVWKEKSNNDNHKSALFSEARGTDNEDTKTTG